MALLLRNRHFLLFVAICAAALAVLVGAGRPLGDLLGALLILGLFLPLLALAATVRLPPVLPARP